MVRFGIIGAGIIARKFADACKQSKGAQLMAIASTSMERANQFAQTFNVPKAYDSYKDLLNGPEIDAVYIAVINSKHLELIKQCAKAGKAVLCEKPFVLTKVDAKEVIALSKETNVLIMEAMWTNFLPATIQVKKWIDQEVIGKVRFMQTSFSSLVSQKDRQVLFNKALGGGGLHDVGIYCLAYSIHMFGAPTAQKSMVQIGETGVDEFGVTQLAFKNGVIAECRYGLKLNLDGNARIYGEEGYIVVHTFWKSTRCQRYNNDHELVETKDFEVVNGFIYQIDHFAALYQNKQIESKVNPLEQSLLFAQLFDSILEKE
ncbi:MAG TPA: Gfo/Idh/MocA family oxidoreductase [Epulopiscium sp.]|nr:Gfo/Idh/MocA family oxidoreductase [Candidatus Epulonipiscium sp.]